MNSHSFEIAPNSNHSLPESTTESPMIEIESNPVTNVFTISQQNDLLISEKINNFWSDKSQQICEVLFEQIDQLTDQNSKLPFFQISSKILAYSQSIYPNPLELDSFSKGKLQMCQSPIAKPAAIQKKSTALKKIFGSFASKPSFEAVQDQKPDLFDKNGHKNTRKKTIQPQQEANEIDRSVYNYKDLIIRKDSPAKLKFDLICGDSTINDFTQRRAVHKEVKDLYVNAIRRESAEVHMLEKKHILNLQDVVFPLKDIYLRMTNNGQLSQLPKSYSCKEKPLNFPYFVQSVKKFID